MIEGKPNPIATAQRLHRVRFNYKVQGSAWLSNAKPYSTFFPSPLMPDRPPSEIKPLCLAYTAFNAGDIDAALATMTSDVAWPRAFKGGFVRGP